MDDYQEMKDRQMISIPCPSRGRPSNVDRLYQSLLDTTQGEWELLVRLDSDDPAVYSRFRSHVVFVTAPRALLSQCWNDLVPYALGDIFMLCGDDITFETKGWDTAVRGAFPADGIAVVHGNDLSPNAVTIGTHPFVTRKWVETLGYLAPPLFSSDYNDLWLCEVADALSRRIYLPDVITEHHHPAFGKAEWDQTHQDRIERHTADDVDKIWAESEPQRQADIEKLRAAI